MILYAVFYAGYNGHLVLDLGIMPSQSRNTFVGRIPSKAHRSQPISDAQLHQNKRFDLVSEVMKGKENFACFSKAKVRGRNVTQDND